MQSATVTQEHETMVEIARKLRGAGTSSKEYLVGDTTAEEIFPGKTKKFWLKAMAKGLNRELQDQEVPEHRR